jgi:peptide/nickel transport system ATP-binding protein
MSTGDQVPDVVLDVQHISKRYRTGGRKTTVDAAVDVSFSIGREKIVALVGQSGSGKSTIARILARLEQPTSGRFILEGRDVIKEEPRRASRRYRREVQMIFQDPFGSLNPVHTVGYSVSRPLKVHRLGAAEQVRTLLETVGLAPGQDYADSYPYELSGGQRQRVAIARALSSQPSLILADEPTSMLDVSIRMGVLNLLQKLRAERKLAYLYITHDLASARYISDEILVMYRGHLVEGGPTEAVIEHAAHPYTQLLLAAVPDPRRPRSAVVDVPAQIELFGECPYAELTGDVSVCDAAQEPRHLLEGGHWIRCSKYGSGTERASVGTRHR